MKRLSIFMTLVALIGFSAFGQQSNPRSSALIKASGEKRIFNFNDSRPTIDTFGNLQSCDSLFYTWIFGPALQNGFLSGHNTYIDSAKAEQYTGLPGNSINGLWMFFSYATSTATTQKVHVKVWDATGPGGTPGAELGTKDVTHASISADIANGDLTTVTFTTPISIPAGGNVYCGFRMDYKKMQGQLKYDSTRAVALANPDLFSACADSASNTAWEQWTSLGGAGGGWHSYWESYGLGTRNPVFPIVQSSSCTVTITPTSATVCKKKSVSLTASVVPAGGTFTWAPATGLNVTTGATVTAKPLTTTTYTATNSQGCSATVTVTVNPTPTTHITQGACSGGAVLLSANAVPNTGVKYKWYLNNAVITGATNATYSATVSGSYKVKVTIQATGCFKTSAPVTVTVSCKLSNINSAAFDASAYPNPFTKSVTVNIATGSTEAANISVLDFSGRTLRIYSDVDASVPFEINENLTPGVYFVKVAQGGNEKLIKVVKSE